MNAAQVLDKARAKGARIATAESCTGGSVAAALTDISGSSDVVECGFITYSNHAKNSMLGVAHDTLERVGAVSEDVAKEMADGALKRSQANLVVSITGIAGPGGSDHKPEGRVCFGLAQNGRATVTQTVEFGPLGRAKVRKASTDHALTLLYLALNDSR